MKFIYLIDQYKNVTIINLREVREIFISHDFECFRIDYGNASIKAHLKEKVMPEFHKLFNFDERKLLEIEVETIIYKKIEETK